MKKRKVINPKNVPLRLPIFETLVCYLCLDKFGAPDWLYGAFGVVFFIIWILVVVDIFIRENLPEME